MTANALLFTLAAIGISESAYLVRIMQLKHKDPECFGTSCTVVLKSKYSNIFIVPNDVLGVLFYIVVAVITAMIEIEVGPTPLLNQALNILVASGSVASLFLTYLQWRIIKAWCFWCLMSAITIWLMGLIILLSS